MHSKEVEEYKKTLQLTEEQREVLVGLLLGDGCLETSNHGRTYRLKIEQSDQHRSYLFHLHNLFSEWTLAEPRQRVARSQTGTETISWKFSTLSHGAFRFYAQQFYAENKKQVPKLIHHWLTPRGLAYWYMDDGSLKSSQSKGMILNTQSFEKRDVQRLVTVLDQNFTLQSSLRKQKDGFQIYISGHSYETFLEHVDPFLLDEMRYKIPPPRRTHLPKE